MLHRIPWSRGSSYESIIETYSKFVTTNYGKAVVVFDGYEEFTTKDMTHKHCLKGKLVIKGWHMVSGTCCPACGDQVKWVRESRAAVLKGQCPVGHKGEFPDVLKGSISGLRRLRLSRAYLRSGR